MHVYLEMKVDSSRIYFSATKGFSLYYSGYRAQVDVTMDCWCFIVIFCIRRYLSRVR